VLEEVRESAAAGRLVGGAHVVPDVHGDLREAVILAQDHGESIGQRVFLELDLRSAARAAKASATDKIAAILHI